MLNTVYKRKSNYFLHQKVQIEGMEDITRMEQGHGGNAVWR